MQKARRYRFLERPSANKRKQERGKPREKKWTTSRQKKSKSSQSIQRRSSAEILKTVRRSMTKAATSTSASSPDNLCLAQRLSTEFFTVNLNSFSSPQTSTKTQAKVFYKSKTKKKMSLRKKWTRKRVVSGKSACWETKKPVTRSKTT